MKNYLCIDGKKTELSKKSIRNIKKSLCETDGVDDVIDSMIDALPDFFACGTNQKKNIQHLYSGGGFGERIKLPLPENNTSWTLWVFDCATKLVNELRAYCEIADVSITHKKRPHYSTGDPKIVVNIKRSYL